MSLLFNFICLPLSVNNIKHKSVDVSITVKQACPSFARMLDIFVSHVAFNAICMITVTDSNMKKKPVSLRCKANDCFAAL